MNSESEVVHSVCKPYLHKYFYYNNRVNLKYPFFEMGRWIMNFVARCGSPTTLSVLSQEIFPYKDRHEFNKSIGCAIWCGLWIHTWHFIQCVMCPFWGSDNSFRLEKACWTKSSHYVIYVLPSVLAVNLSVGLEQKKTHLHKWKIVEHQ